MRHYLKYFILIVLLACAGPAYADGKSDICTDNIEYTEGADKNANILSEVVGMIGTVLNGLLKAFYNNIVMSTEYQVMVYAMIVLTVVIYGVMIMFNMASLKPYIVFTRIAKITLIFALISPAVWGVYNQYVIGFFLGTMNDLISMFTQLASAGTINGYTQYAGYSGGASDSIISEAPLSLVSAVLGMVFTPKFLVLLLGSANTGIFGLIFFFLLLNGALGLCRAGIGAAVTYVKALVGLTFFLGLGPMFIPLIFFAETKKIFQGWLQQVVSLVLQPVMLFAFLAFFLVMINATLISILRQDFCWVSTPIVEGLPISISKLTPKSPNASQGATEANTKDNPYIYPLSTFDVFIFLLLVELMWRYSKFVGDTAKDFSSGALNLIVSGGDVRQWSKSLTGGSKMDKVRSYMGEKHAQAESAHKAQEAEYDKIETQLGDIHAQMDRMKVDDSDQAKLAKKQLSAEIDDLTKKRDVLGKSLGKKVIRRAGGENMPGLERVIGGGGGAA